VLALVVGVLVLQIIILTLQVVMYHRQTLMRTASREFQRFFEWWERQSSLWEVGQPIRKP